MWTGKDASPGHQFKGNIYPVASGMAASGWWTQAIAEATIAGCGEPVVMATVDARVFWISGKILPCCSLTLGTTLHDSQCTKITSYISAGRDARKMRPLCSKKPYSYHTCLRSCVRCKASSRENNVLSNPHFLVLIPYPYPLFPLFCPFHVWGSGSQSCIVSQFGLIQEASVATMRARYYFLMTFCILKNVYALIWPNA